MMGSGSGILCQQRLPKKFLVNVRFSAGMAVMLLLVGGAWQLAAAY